MHILKKHILALTFSLLCLFALTFFLNSSRVALLISLLFLMIYFWIREDVPQWVPGIFPLVFLMPLGFLPLKNILHNYFSDVTFLFFGGMVLAVAIEKHSLHHWFFNKFIFVFNRTKGLTLLGIITLSVILSSFISNTATALLLISTIRQTKSPTLLLAMGYGASLGGLATIIGSPVNAIFMNFWNQSHTDPITFANWIKWTFPLMILGIFILWAVLSFPYYNEKKTTGLDFLPSVVLKKIHKIVIIIFFSYLAGWGLGSFIPQFPKESHWALLMAAITFLFPKKLSEKKILIISDLKKINWSLLLIFGASLSFAEAISSSALIGILTENVAALGDYPYFYKLFALVLLMIFFTELCSNTAAAAIFIPLVAGIHQGLNLPLFPSIFAVTAAASLSFMLPTATPPSAIIFSTKILPLQTMLKTGFILNIIFALLITLWAMQLPDFR